MQLWFVFGKKEFTTWIEKDIIAKIEEVSGKSYETSDGRIPDWKIARDSKRE